MVKGNEEESVITDSRLAEAKLERFLGRLESALERLEAVVRRIDAKELNVDDDAT